MFPANVCFPLPESLPLERGALFEPSGVAVHAMQRRLPRRFDRGIELLRGESAKVLISPN